MDELIGKKLDGRYKIETLIGVGGMANVYKATDLKNDSTVAVKVLRQEYMSNKELVRRFKDESKAISLLDHPNIVKVYDVSVTDKLQYIVMEYLSGITLKEYMEKRGEPLAWKETVHFTQQILKALEHAHGKGVVHRDVKPQNIMLLEGGNLKMMDFGIARFSRAETQVTSNKAIGSVHYISPEQAKGEQTTATTDIYSVGVMMYEMLSGKLPFDSEDAISVAMKQITEKPKPLADLAPETPKALQEIVEKAMAKNSADRYQSATEMLDALKKFKDDPTIQFDYKYMGDDTEQVATRVVQQSATGAAVAVINTGKAAQSRKQKQVAADTKAAKGKEKKKKKGKSGRFSLMSILVGITVAFLVGSAILCYIIFSNSTNPLFSVREDVDLVDFTGMSIEDIQANETYTKSFTFNIEEIYNSEIPAGQVYSQTPKPPRAVKEGQLVTLKVSKGTEYITVPDVRNHLQSDATSTLRELGLTVTVRPVVADDVTVGTVINTDPAAKTQVESGSTIILYVSQAVVDTDREVPQLVGLSLSDALTALENNNLVLGTQTEAYSDTYPAGIIVEQSYPASTSVKMNTKVNVIISLGAQPAGESVAPEGETAESTAQ